MKYEMIILLGLAILVASALAGSVSYAWVGIVVMLIGALIELLF